MTILLLNPFQWLVDWGLLVVILLAIFNLVPASVSATPTFFSHALPYLLVILQEQLMSVFSLGEYYQPFFSGASTWVLSPCVDLAKWVSDSFSVISAKDSLAIF